MRIFATGLAEMGAQNAALSLRSRAMLIALTAASAVPGQQYSFDGATYLGSPGAGIIPDLPNLVPVGPVHPEHFKDHATHGVTEMADAVQMVLAAGYSVYAIKGRVYKLSDTSELTFDNQIVDFRGAPIDATDLRTSKTSGSPNRVQKIFDVVGSERMTTTLASAVADGALVATLTSVTGIEAGDVIRFVSTGQRWYSDGAATPIMRSWTTRIEQINGSDVTVQEPFPFGFDTGVASVDVQVWRGVKGARVYVGSATGPGYVKAQLNGEGEGVAGGYFAQDLRVEIESCVGFQGVAAWVSQFYNVDVTIKNCQGWPDGYNAAYSENDNSGFAGAFFYRGAKFRFHDGSGSRVRHIVDGQGAWDGIIANVHAWDTHRSAYTCHDSCSEWVFSQTHYKANTISACLWRGHNVTTIGNNWDCGTANGTYGFYDTAGDVDDLPKTYTFIGDTIRAGRQCVFVNANVGHVSIQPAHYRGGYETLYAPVQFSSLQIGVASISGGGIIETSVAGDCIYVGGTAAPDSREFLSVKGVTLKGYTDSAVDCAHAYPPDVVEATGNTLIPGVGATTHMKLAGNVRYERGPNFLIDGTIYDPDHAGSWTPVLSDGTNNATGTGLATWSRDLNGMVTCNGRIVLTAKGSISGNLRISGQPYAVKAGTYGGGFVTDFANLALAGNYAVTIRCLAGDSFGLLRVTDHTASMTPLIATEVTDTTQLYFSFSYQS